MSSQSRLKNVYIAFHKCESFNGMVRRFNVFGNRQPPSRDIAKTFCTKTALLCLSQGQVTLDQRYIHMVFINIHICTMHMYSI